MSRIADFLTSEKRAFRSLSADISTIENAEAYRAEYGIPAGEPLLIYAYSSGYSAFALEGSGTILTDSALYFHPSHRDWAASNRIDFSDLPSYFVFQENSLDMVHLLNAKEDIPVFGRTVAPNDTTGHELVLLLRHLQKELIGANPMARARYQAAEGAMLDSIGRSFRSYGVLTPYYDTLLTELSAGGDFDSMTAVYRAENYYRLCSRGQYFAFLETLTGETGEKLKKALKQPDRKFFDDYIEDLSTPSVFTFTNSLLEAYKNLRSKPRLLMSEGLILLYLCVYMGDRGYFAELYRKLEAAMPMSQKVRLQTFLARQKNERMTKVYDRLLSGIMPEGKEWELTDSLGLDPLHYALILKNPSLVRKVLLSGDFTLRDKKCGGVRPGDQTYDYFFAAAIIYEDDALLRDVYIGTRRQARPLVRSLKRLDALIEINSSLYERDKDRAYLDRANELLSMRKEIAEELDARVQEEKEKARERAKTIFESRHTFACYLVSVLTDPDKIFENLAETASSCRVYRYRDVCFVTPAERKMDLDYVLVRNNEIESMSFPGLTDSSEEDFYSSADTYENPAFAPKKEEKAKDPGAKTRALGSGHTMLHRFFTEAADSDIRELKRQYRELLKKYHPDVTGNAADAAVIRAVIEERAAILDAMPG